MKGAEKTGQLVKYGSNKLREHMAPAAEPSVIDPRARQGAYYAHKATHCAVKVSSFVGWSYFNLCVNYYWCRLHSTLPPILQ